MQLIRINDQYRICFKVLRATPEFDEFVVVGDAEPGSLKVKKWSDEGTS